MSKVYKRKAIFEELSNYCPLSNKNDFMEITEWGNGEGFDVVISSHWRERQVSLTWGEFELMTKLLSIITRD